MIKLSRIINVSLNVSITVSLSVLLIFFLYRYHQQVFDLMKFASKFFFADLFPFSQNFSANHSGTLHLNRTHPEIICIVYK